MNISTFIFLLLVSVLVIGCSEIVYPISEENETVELRGVIGRIYSIPEGPKPPTSIALTWEGGGTYLDIDEEKFNETAWVSHTFIVVKGYYLNDKIFYVESIELDKDNIYIKNKYYCELDEECYGSLKGNVYDQKTCDRTECINVYSVNLQTNQCHYDVAINYASKGGQCECISNTCTALEPINFIEVAKEHCLQKGLNSCDDCNFRTPKGWAGLALQKWRANGFDCELEPAPGHGLQAYSYLPCGCGETNCVQPAEETVYFVFDKVIAEMTSEKESGRIQDTCFLS